MRILVRTRMQLTMRIPARNHMQIPVRMTMRISMQLPMRLLTLPYSLRHWHNAQQLQRRFEYVQSINPIFFDHLKAASLLCTKRQIIEVSCRRSNLLFSTPTASSRIDGTCSTHFQAFWNLLKIPDFQRKPYGIFSFLLCQSWSD